MLVNVGSFLIILLLIYGAMIHKKNYMMFVLKVYILFAVYIEIGYFLKIGTFQMSYSELITVFFVFVGIFSIKKINIPITSTLIVIAFIVVIFIGYFLLLNNPSPPYVLPIGGSWDRLSWGMETFSEAHLGMSHVLRTIRIVLFIAVYFIFEKSFANDDIRVIQIKKYVIKLAIISAFIGILDQFLKIAFGSSLVTETANSIFGIGLNQLTWFTERGSLPVLQGLMLEPGHYATSFIPAILILLRDKLFTEKKRFWIFLLFSYAIFFSGSLAGFAILFYMMLLYFFSSRKHIILKIGAAIFVSAIATFILSKNNPALLEYYFIRINAFLNNVNIGTTSESVRLLSVKNALGLFLDHPFFGVGFGSSDFHGFIPSMLANFGILGTILWVTLMMCGFTRTSPNNVLWLIILIPFLFFIGNVETIYSLSMILIFTFVFRKSYKYANENYAIPIKLRSISLNSRGN